MKNKELIVVVIIALVLIILQKKRAFDSLELKPSYPRNFKFVPLTNLEFDMPFQAFNGSAGTLNIGSIDLRVYAEGQYIGRAFAAGNQQILPNGRSTLTSRVYVSLLDMASAIPGFLAGVQDQTVNLQMQGNLNVEGFYKSIDLPVSFNLPKFR